MDHVSVAESTAHDIDAVAFVSVLDDLGESLALHSPVIDEWGDVSDSRVVWANRSWLAAARRVTDDSPHPTRDSVLAHVAMAWREGRSQRVVHPSGDVESSAPCWVTWHRSHDLVVETGRDLDGLVSPEGGPVQVGRVEALVARRRALAAERARIARGLHDIAIQRLYASRLGISVLGDRVGSDVRDDLDGLALSIDAVIADIREQVLGDATHGAPPLRARLEDVLAAIAAPHDCDYDLDLDSELRLSDTLVGHVRAVVVEATSNAVRHGSASMVWVALERRGGMVALTVADNGSGIGVTPRRDNGTPGNGMRNMRNRANSLGGTFKVSPRPAGGTHIEWCVPIEAVKR